MGKNKIFSLPSHQYPCLSICLFSYLLVCGTFEPGFLRKGENKNEICATNSNEMLPNGRHAQFTSTLQSLTMGILMMTFFVFLVSAFYSISFRAYEYDFFFPILLPLLMFLMLLLLLMMPLFFYPIFISLLSRVDRNYFYALGLRAQTNDCVHI